jgi:hypothetical protein
MRSFILSALTVLAFGLFCSAAPTPNLLPSVAVAARDTAVSRGNSQTLQCIIADATNALNPIAAEVAGLVEVVEVDLCAILQEVVVILETAVADVEALVNVSVDVCLIDVVTGVLYDLQGLLQLIVPLIRLVICLLQNVIKLLAGAVLADVLALVHQIGGLLAQLLCAILAIVGSLIPGLIAAIVAEIGDLIAFILSLGCQQLLVVLCISI